MSREEWMQSFGAPLASESWFYSHRPGWYDDPNSRWMQDCGREGGKEPLWMRREWHMPELDCPPGRDRADRTLDERKRAGEVPLWAQRMNLSGGRQGDQCATIYGLRAMYKPTEKTDARSMVGAAGRGRRAPRCASRSVSLGSRQVLQPLAASTLCPLRPPNKKNTKQANHNIFDCPCSTSASRPASNAR